MEVSEVLREGKRLIEEHGWIQGKVGNKGEGFCALGGAYEAVESGPWTLASEASAALVRVLPPGFSWIDFEKHYKHPLARYNDTPGRTKQDVLDLYNKAIEAAG